MTIQQNEPNGKIILAPTSHLVEDEFDGACVIHTSLK